MLTRDFFLWPEPGVGASVQGPPPHNMVPSLAAHRSGREGAPAQDWRKVFWVGLTVSAGAYY